jgi:hypothetical protein
MKVSFPTNRSLREEVRTVRDIMPLEETNGKASVLSPADVAKGL